jgi:glutathione/glutaredoxin type arsenate reductase
MKKVIFICKKNSRRSQMAEGFAKEFGEGKIFVSSAGLEKSQIDPATIMVMAEVGIDISQQCSQALSEFDPLDFDVVISLCGCGINLPKPWLERELFEDWQLTDPEGLGVEIFREVRDLVKARVLDLISRVIQKNNIEVP